LDVKEAKIVEDHPQWDISEDEDAEKDDDSDSDCLSENMKKMISVKIITRKYKYSLPLAIYRNCMID
jgi:hypothetical protein